MMKNMSERERDLKNQGSEKPNENDNEKRKEKLAQPPAI